MRMRDAGVTAGVAVFAVGLFAGASSVTFSAVGRAVDARMVQQSDVPIELAANPKQYNHSTQTFHNVRPGGPPSRHR